MRYSLPCLFLLAATLGLFAPQGRSQLALAHTQPSTAAAWDTAPPPGSNQVLLTIELAKAAGSLAAQPVSIQFPTACSECQAVTDPAYARQNSRVIILAMRVPVSHRLPLSVDVFRQHIRRVLLEGVDLPFTTTAGLLHFTVPAEPVNRVNSGEFQTHILWPGIDLRLEHGDPGRRAGKYADGPWPALQLKAAHNLEFAQLYALRILGLDTYVIDQNVGTIDLMGFDTNFPHGHDDYPPHMHMILWWPTVTGAGSLIGHYYISPQGLLTHNEVIPLRVLGLIATSIPPGVPYTDTDDTGQPVYTHTITTTGALTLSRPGGGTCSIDPSGDALHGGFGSGASVHCQGFAATTVQVSDDVAHGVLRVVNTTNALSHTNTYTYDTDTGRLFTSQ